MSYREKIDKESFMKLLNSLMIPPDAHFVPKREEEVRHHVLEIAWDIIELVTTHADEDEVDTLALLAGLENTFGEVQYSIGRTFGNAIKYVMNCVEIDQNPLGE